MNRITDIKEMIISGARHFGENIAICSGENTVTYSGLLLESRNCSSFLLQNLEHDSVNRIAIYMEKKMDLCVSFYGVLSSGFSAMILSPEIPPAQIFQIIRKYSPKSIIVDPTTMLRLKEGLKNYNLSAFVTSMEKSFDIQLISEKKPSRKNQKASAIAPDSEGVVLFTSGTTGERKAVSISHENLIKTSKMTNEYLAINKPKVELVTPPLFQAFGLRRVISNHLTGGTVIFEDGVFNPAKALQIIRDFSCQGFSGVPAVFKIMDSSQSRYLRDIGSKLEYIITSAAPLSANEKKYLCEIFPKSRLYMYYGLTEAAISVFLNISEDQKKLHTIGKPSPGILIKVVNGCGLEIENGQTGEIWVKGFNVADAYLMNQELTKEKFSDKWFKTGDIGRFDSDGYLELIGRKDEMMNIGGKKMYPGEIENYISSRYKNIDFAVTGIEEKYLGEKPLFCYSQNTPVNNLLFSKILTDLKKEFEDYKVPREKLEILEIPRTTNGKVQRKRLKKILENKLTNEN